MAPRDARTDAPVAKCGLSERRFFDHDPSTLVAMTSQLEVARTSATTWWAPWYERPRAWWASRNGLTSDGLLYALSALFAVTLGYTSSQLAQWHWGFLTIAPYGGAAVVALLLGRFPLRRDLFVRLVLLGIVLVGAVAIPLILEARWRHQDPNQGYAQPEVSVIERSATYISQGKDPYRSYYTDGRIVDPVRGVPAYESFFPYFPLMGVFGLPSAETHQRSDLSDARIVMSLMTVLASIAALAMLRTTREKKIRIAQVLIALPTGALFLATGGDDMPILALMLLGVAALQRRSSVTAGVSFGVAAAMKLTAWPVAFGALLVAYDHKGRRAWGRIALWITGIVAVTVTPFIVKAPWAFVANVFAFPLGLAHVASPAASDLPGHVLTTWWPPLGHVLAPVSLLVAGFYGARYARRRWPLSLSQLLGIMSLFYLLLICVASATRIGYVIYPINLALWAWVVREPVRAPREDVLV